MTSFLAHSNPATSLGMAELTGRVGLILHDLERACLGIQDQLTELLQSREAISSAAQEQIQELDRVTQTLENLATLLVRLGRDADQGTSDVARAVGEVKLLSVRARLLSLGDADLSSLSLEEIELF